MAFALQLDEPVGKSVKRLVHKQVDKAVKALGQSDKLDEAIHDTRQRFKRVRALLRLVRDELGEEVYRQENRCFRDAARPLTEVRDAVVLVGTLEKLVDHFAGDIAANSFAQMREVLLANKIAVHQRVVEEEDAISTVTAAVESARSRIRDWSIAHEGWAAVEPGLKRVYRRACRAHAAAFTHPSAENMHEWRKQTKYLWHQFQVLEPICPKVMKELCNQAHQLSQLLGDDHDLSVLRQKVAADPQAFGGTAKIESLAGLIERRRLELARDAFLLAERVYGDKPNRLVSRISGYWKARHSAGARAKSAS